MIARIEKRAIVWVAGVLLAGACAFGAPPEKLTGSIVGLVSDSASIPQMGATVLLFNGLDRLVQRALTDESGGFLFASLSPGAYSLRVSLASFLPALKRHIVVEPGTRSLLSVNLATVFSSIELVYSSTGTSSIMSDDWKWVLRSGSATRPVLRLVPSADDKRRSSVAGLFSDTHGLLKISAGDQGAAAQYDNQPDLGTAFALATSVFGNNQVHVSGNFGYSAATGIPAAGFRTSYSHDSPATGTSQVNLTMRQLYMPARAGMGLVGGQDGAAPALRTMSVGALQNTHLADNLLLQYGFTMESVSFLDTLNYFSPFGRLSSFPRISLRNGRARVQRSENFELAYQRTVGSRTYGLAAYRESVANAAMTMVAPAGAIPSSDLLPDLLSSSAIFNAGDYASTGYMASLTQALGERMNLTLAGGRGDALVPAGRDLANENADALRALLRHGQRHWVLARFSATIPGPGTQFSTSYRWSDGSTLSPPHAYLTQSLRPDIGWNIYFRQPVPAFLLARGRLEMTAELRNLLAQGYLSLTTPAGDRVYLLQTPRSFRGGLAFSF